MRVCVSQTVSVYTAARSANTAAGLCVRACVHVSSLSVCVFVRVVGGPPSERRR